MTRHLDPLLEETVNLYLDGRLGGAERAEFERLLEADGALREAVEFHRGLTLEFQEEAPPLPRGYADRAATRLQRALERGDAASHPAVDGSVPGRTPRPILWWRRGLPLAALGAAFAVALVVILRPHLRPSPPPEVAEGVASTDRPAEAPRRAPSRSRQQAGRDRDKAMDEAADAETTQALRSLGYLAGGADTGKAAGGVAGRAPKKSAPRVDKTRVVETQTARERPGIDRSPLSGLMGAQTVPPPPPPTEAKSEPVANAAETPAPVAAAKNDVGAKTNAGSPVPAASATADRAQAMSPPGAGAAPATAPPASSPELAPAAIVFRILPVDRAPDLGRDHLVIRSAEEWSAFLPAMPATGVDFGREMAIVVRDDLGSDPPSRLRIVAITGGAEGIEVDGRVERLEAATTQAGSVPRGQALVLPAGPATVRIMIEKP
ncbi:MAG TPA: hypothetical protein VFT43_05915 [Candidatus Polarisedimenticolia bacterium]|nr:hypothetical protein [Candidatus Polarisedimenticolia bacterium]